MAPPRACSGAVQAGVATSRPTSVLASTVVATATVSTTVPTTGHYRIVEADA